MSNGDDLGLRGIGDNNPPEPTPLDKAELLVPACDDWTSRGALTSEDEARVLSEFLDQIRKAREMIKAGAIKDRQPHLDALAAIRATVAHLMEPHEQALEMIGARAASLLPKLELAIERIGGSKRTTGLLADWMSSEKARLAAEAEAKRKEAEDAARAAQHAADAAAVDHSIDAAVAAEEAARAADDAAAAARKAPTRARVRGDLAPRAVQLREFWSARIIDWTKARRHYRTNPRVKEAYDEMVQLCANEEARKVKDRSKAPDGIEFEMREQAQ
jgi:hypothetical protein